MHDILDPPQVGGLLEDEADLAAPVLEALLLEALLVGNRLALVARTREVDLGEVRRLLERLPGLVAIQAGLDLGHWTQRLGSLCRGERGGHDRSASGCRLFPE